MLAADEQTVGNQRSRPIEALRASNCVFCIYVSPQNGMYACKQSILSVQGGTATAAVNVGHQGHDTKEAADAGFMLLNFVETTSDRLLVV